jgi:hypothetical protein
MTEHKNVSVSMRIDKLDENNGGRLVVRVMTIILNYKTKKIFSLSRKRKFFILGILPLRRVLFQVVKICIH